MKKLKTLALSLVVMIMVIIGTKSIYASDTHDYSFSFYDSNLLEETGTGDEYADGDQIDPGRVFQVDINYDVGATPVKSMQIGIQYDPTVLEVLYDGPEVFAVGVEPTTLGGIYPPAGTSSTTKKKTNWTVLSNVDTAAYDAGTSPYYTLKLIIKDTKVSATLEESGLLATLQFKVKDDAPAGSTVDLKFDKAFTMVSGGYPVTTEDKSLSLFGAMSSVVTLKEFSLTGSNSTDYTPAFTPGTSDRTFTTTVPNNVDKITIAAAPTDELATILTGGLGQKNLAVGSNTFTLTVQAQDGKQELYTINVYRLNNDAKLSTLTASGVTYDYPFASTTYTYTATVPYALASTTIAATTSDSKASITAGTGSWDLNNLGTTLNTKTVTVKAENCKTEYASVAGNTCTSQDYTLNITRTNPSTDADLIDIKIDGTSITGFHKDTLTYTLANAANAKTSINITATASDTKIKSITGTGSKSLVVGDNTFSIVTVAEDGTTTKTYQINIRRLSNDATLSDLTVTSAPTNGTFTPTFSSAFTNFYTYTYDPDVTSITVSATTTHANATITSGTGTYSNGDTGANVVVTAEDGTVKTYIVKFSRKQSTDATLKSLSLTGIAFNETFSSATTLYTATVAGTVSQVEINAEVNDTGKATIVSGTGTKSLNYGTNTFQVKVKAENGTTKDYTITVTRSKKTISSLSDLKVDGTTVTGFSETTTAYTVNVPFTTTSVNVTATAKDAPDATVSGTGTKTLHTGTNTITVTVTAHDGTTKTPYTLTVNRAKSNDATLSDLKVNGTSVTGFNANTKNYTVTVPYTTTTANITYTKGYVDATDVLGGNTNLSVGDNNFTVSITSEDGLTTNIYNVKVVREQSINTNLSSLTVKGSDNKSYLVGFNKNTKTYDISVPNNVTSVTIAATAEEPTNQTITGTGTFNLPTEEVSFPVEVTAASGAKDTYTVKITRAKNGDNTLSSLAVVDYSISPTFASNKTSYTLSVGSNVDKIRITAAANVSTSTVSGDVGEKSLVTGTNTFNITVTAENSTTKTYVIVVTRAASNDSTLKTLSIDETILNETFAPTTTSYTASVANTVTSINIVGVANDPKAKSVTGTGAKTLSTGPNTFNIVVTAEDNTTTTYQVVVTRAKNTYALLDGIGLNGGYTLDPAFDKNTFEYNVTVTNSTKKLLISTTKGNSLQTVTGAGEVSLNTGNNDVTINVTAEDPNSKKAYVLHIFRLLSSDTTLSSIASTDGLITPTPFDPTNHNYTLTVPFEVENADLTATTTYPDASYTVSGNTNLSVGTQKATITVQAEDGTVDFYYVDITRQPSSNNFLSDLQVLDADNNNLITVFNKTQSTYKLTVENDITSVVINGDPEVSSITVSGDTGAQTLQVGTNTFVVKSTSESGVDRNYTIEVTRKQNANTNLSTLEVVGHTIVPDFSNSESSYTLIVDETVDEITINATAEVSTSTVTGTGTFNISTGVQTYTITVTAEDNSKKSFTIVVNKAASNNSYLASLEVIGEEIIPKFDRDTYDYYLTVPNATTEIEISAMLEHPSATLSGDLGVQNVLVGNNTFTVIVTAEDNTFSAYNVFVKREPSTNNDLSDLKVNGTTISGFDKDTTSYTLNVDNDTTYLDIEGVAADAMATISGNRIWLLDTGSNSIDVAVTAESGAIKNYTIIVNRALSSNTNLSSLGALEGTLDPTFDKNTLTYTMNVPYETTSLTLITVTEDNDSKVEIEGNTDFQVGNSNVVSITVIAEDKSTKTYQITVTRQQQANNFLKQLSIRGANGKTYALNPTFNKNTLSYQVEIDSTEQSVIVLGMAESESATVTGLNETIATEGAMTTHEIKVTSAGGIDRVYKLTITKAAGSEKTAYLKSFRVSSGSLSPAYNPFITSYTVSVASDVDEIDFITTTNYTTDVVIGDGKHSLSYGENNFTVSVTCETGETTSYSVTVTRASNSDATLKDLKISGALLTQSFTPTTLGYSAYIGKDAETVSITPTTNVINADLYYAIGEGEYTSISSVPLTLNVADLTDTVKVKVVNGTDTKIYTIDFLTQADEKITSNTYGHDIDGDYITSAEEKTNKDDFLKQFDNEIAKLELYHADSITKHTTGPVGTGEILKLIINDKVVDQKTIIVKGDTDGNGVVDIGDLLDVANYVIGEHELIGPYMSAANTFNDKTVDISDILRIANHLIGEDNLYKKGVN